MKSLFFKGLKTLLFTVALCATISTQAMEQQEEKHEYNFLVEALDEAMRNNNPVACSELFKSFSEDLGNKEAIEQTAVMVALIQESTPKNAELAVVFCNVLVDIFMRSTQDLTAIMQEVTTPIVNPLIEANNIRALEKIACIFADNKTSQECVSITEAIENNTTGQNDSTVDIDGDEAIARFLQESPDENVTPADNNEEFNLALALSESEFTNPNAPTAVDLRELDEETEVSIAIEESLQNNTTASNPSTLKKLFNILLGGLGS